MIRLIGQGRNTLPDFINSVMVRLCKQDRRLTAVSRKKRQTTDDRLPPYL